MLNWASIVALIILAGIAMFAVVAVILVIYFCAYRKNINKAVVLGEEAPRKMLPPYKLFLILGIGAFLIIVGVSACKIGKNSNGSSPEDKYYEAIYGYNMYVEEQMQEGYRSVYSIEENKGYTKDVIVKGDVKFTCFISETGYDNIHPRFIIYIEYTGDKELVTFCYNGKFKDNKENVITGYGTSGRDITKNEVLTVIGNTDINCIFELSIYYFDEFVKAENVEELAVVAEKLELYIP